MTRTIAPQQSHLVGLVGMHLASEEGLVEEVPLEEAQTRVKIHLQRLP